MKPEAMKEDAVAPSVLNDGLGGFNEEMNMRCCFINPNVQTGSALPEIVGWRHKDRKDSIISDRVKKLWERVNPLKVKNYPIPLYAIGGKADTTKLIGDPDGD